MVSLWGYVTHVISRTRPSQFSACNIEKAGSGLACEAKTLLFACMLRVRGGSSKGHNWNTINLKCGSGVALTPSFKIDL